MSHSSRSVTSRSVTVVVRNVACGLLAVLLACEPSQRRPDFSRPDELETGLKKAVECARSRGAVACRGTDERGLLGRGQVGVSQPSWVTIDGFDDAVDVDLSLTESFACVLRRSGEVWCWGMNLFDVLGRRVPRFQGDVSMDRAVGAPAKIDGLPSVVELVVDAFHACAIAGDGGVYCWGNNGLGQVVDPRVDGRDAVYPPVRVALPGRSKAVHLQDSQSCALQESGELSCWGGAAPAWLGGGPAYGPVVVERNVRHVTTDHVKSETCVDARSGVHCWSPLSPEVSEQFDEPHVRRRWGAP